MAAVLGRGGGVANALRLGLLRALATAAGELKLINLTVFDDDGRRHKVVAPPGATLASVLETSGIETERFSRSARWGWNAHVTVANEYLTKLPEMSGEEDILLNDITDDVTANSRLASFIKVTPDLEGMVCALSKTKPWKAL